MLETAACLLARHFKPNRAVHEHRERREREQYESREAQRDGAWQLRYHGRGTVLLSCHPSQLVHNDLKPKTTNGDKNS